MLHFFEVVPYFSPQVPITISETVLLSSTVPLLAPASTVSSSVPPVETQDSPAPKSVQGFKYFYTHRPKVPASEPVLGIFSLVDGHPPPPSASSLWSSYSITLRKGKRSGTDHSISNFVSYDHLNPTYCQFALSFSSESIPRSYTEVLLVPAWK